MGTLTGCDLVNTIVQRFLHPLFHLLDQPDHGVVAVGYLAAVGELCTGFFQAPPEAVQEVTASGTAALDQLQVDVGFGE